MRPADAPAAYAAAQRAVQLAHRARRGARAHRGAGRALCAGASCRWPARAGLGVRERHGRGVRAFPRARGSGDAVRRRADAPGAASRRLAAGEAVGGADPRRARGRAVAGHRAPGRVPRLRPRHGNDAEGDGGAGVRRPAGRVDPGASHINHMPSHTYNRVGRWGTPRGPTSRRGRRTCAPATATASPSIPPTTCTCCCSRRAWTGRAPRPAGRPGLCPAGAERRAPSWRWCWCGSAGSGTRWRSPIAVASHPPRVRGVRRGMAHLRLGARGQRRVYAARVDSLAVHTPPARVLRQHAPAQMLGITGGILRGEILRQRGVWTRRWRRSRRRCGWKAPWCTTSRSPSPSAPGTTWGRCCWRQGAGGGGAAGLRGGAGGPAPQRLEPGGAGGGAAGAGQGGGGGRGGGPVPAGVGAVGGVAAGVAVLRLGAVVPAWLEAGLERSSPGRFKGGSRYPVQVQVQVEVPGADAGSGAGVGAGDLGAPGKMPARATVPFTFTFTIPIPSVPAGCQQPPLMVESGAGCRKNTTGILPGFPTSVDSRGGFTA
jgi:hypothetical protein